MEEEEAMALFSLSYRPFSFPVLRPCVSKVIGSYVVPEKDRVYSVCNPVVTQQQPRNVKNLSLRQQGGDFCSEKVFCEAKKISKRE